MDRTTLTLDSLEHLLATTTDPKALFGADRYAFLTQVQVACHPDRYRGNPADAERADRLRKRVEAMAEEIDRPALVKSSKRTYQLLQRIGIGDVADIHLAESDGKNYVVKVSRVPEGARLLDAEAKAVADVWAKAGTTHYSHYLPTLAESFAVKDTITKRVNVFVHEPGFYSLETVHAQHPALDGRHLAWIFKRLLTAIGFAHRCGWVHGAVLPSHVLVHAENHGLQLIGWGQAVKIGEKITSGSANYLGWYPVEVISKKAVRTSTDVYLAAKTMVWLSGGDATSNSIPASVPAEISRFLRSCLIEGPAMRPEDAWGLLDSFNEVLQGTYGPPRYHKLTMS